LTEENRFKKYVKQHKEEIIMAGVTITAVVGAVFLVKNIETLDKAVRLSSTPTVKPKTVPMKVATITDEPILKTIDVREHLRTLPNGYHASAHKIKEAAENGIVLATNQTLVSSHPRHYAA